MCIHAGETLISLLKRVGHVKKKGEKIVCSKPGKSAHTCNLSLVGAETGLQSQGQSELHNVSVSEMFHVLSESQFCEGQTSCFLFHLLIPILSLQILPPPPT